MVFQAQQPDNFIQSAISVSSPYLNQPFLYTVRVYSTLLPDEVQLILPSFEGFGQQELSPVESFTEVVSGIPYIVYTKEFELYPNLTGSLVITPAYLVIPETPFTPQETLASTAHVVTVRSLPPGMPDSYTNAIGNFTLLATLSHNQVSLNEPITFTITITGNGNLQQLTLPKLTLDPKIWRVLVRPAQVQLDKHQKQFFWTIIPLQIGTHQIPSIELSSFNPTTNAYENLTSSAQTIEVIGKTIVSSPASLTPAQLPLKPFQPTYFFNEEVPRQVWLFWAVPPIIWWLSRAKKTPKQSRPLYALQPKTIKQLKEIVQLPPDEALPILQKLVSAYEKAYPKTDETLQALKKEIEQASYAPITQKDIKRFASQFYTLTQSVKNGSKQ